jgi:hypothetical protein
MFTGAPDEVPLTKDFLGTELKPLGTDYARIIESNGSIHNRQRQHGS